MSTTENSHTKPQRRWLRRILLGLASIVGICILGVGILIYAMLRSYEDKIPQVVVDSTSDAGDVSLALMYRLMRHERESAQELVYAESWPDIDKWMRNHQPIYSCTTKLVNDVDGPFGVGGSRLDETGQEYFNYSWTYFCFEDNWIIEFDDIEIHQVDGDWQVKGWRARKDHY